MGLRTINYNFLICMLLISSMLGCAVDNSAIVKRRVLSVIDGNKIKLMTGDIYQLIGITIPAEGPNKMPDLIMYVKNLLIDKEVKVVVIEKIRVDYPKYPLAIIYLNNNEESVNEKLISEGKAFFDHGYYPGKEKFQELEDVAKENKIGLWANKDKLILLYVGSKKWKFVYHPNDSKVKKIQPKDRVEYYIEPPLITLYRSPMPFPQDNELIKALTKE